MKQLFCCSAFVKVFLYCKMEWWKEENLEEIELRVMNYESEL